MSKYAGHLVFAADAATSKVKENSLLSRAKSAGGVSHSTQADEKRTLATTNTPSVDVVPSTCVGPLPKPNQLLG